LWQHDRSERERSTRHVFEGELTEKEVFELVALRHPSAPQARTLVPLHHPARPANERLTLNHAGDVVLQLKSPYHDGTTHIVMSPLEFMQRLAALVPAQGSISFEASIPCMFIFNDVYIVLFGRGRPFTSHGNEPEIQHGSLRPS